RRAVELTITNRVLSAAEALDWGVVTMVVPDDQVESEAGSLVARLAAGPTRAFGRAKRLLQESLGSSLESHLARESEAIVAAAAAQTERIRVGHGAVVCVPEINHPVRIAERAAALDIVSRGRLELGTARSSTWTELGGFGADPDETKKAWDEYVRVLPRLFA